MKKTGLLMMFLLVSLLMVGCGGKSVSIEFEPENVQMTSGDILTLDVKTSDKKGLSYDVSDKSIATISSEGKITALKEGSTSITIKSKTDAKKKLEVALVVYKKILIEIDQAFSLMENEVKNMNLSTSENFTFESKDQTIFTVSQTGDVTAKKNGSAILLIKSGANPLFSKEVTITVTKFISINVDEFDMLLLIDEVVQLDVEASEDINYKSSDETVATVDGLGRVTAVGNGQAIIKIIANAMPSFYKEVKVFVYQTPTAVEITAIEKINVKESVELVYNILPANAHQGVTFSSNDELVASFVDGRLVGHRSGLVVITIKSTVTEDVLAEMTVEVIDQILVKQDANSGSHTHEGIKYEFGTTMFNSISDAMANANDGSTITVLEGTYNNALIIDKEVMIVAENATLSNKVTISADMVTIDGFKFDSNGYITTSGHISDLNIINNQFTQTVKTAIEVIGVSNILIEKNQIEGSLNGIIVRDFNAGIINVRNNTIGNVSAGILIDAENEYAADVSIRVERNKIANTAVGIEFDLLYGTNQKDIHAYARFNQVTETIVLAKQSIGSHVDFTLNYWGSETPAYEKFSNINDNELRGFYSQASKIISESKYNPLVPIKFEIKSEVDELIIGDTFQLEFSVLPMDMETNRVKWITSDPSVLMVVDGLLTPGKSGIATITIRSSIDTSVNAQITIKVTTTPGVELSLDDTYNNLTPNKALQLNATPFPYTVKDEALVYSSSDDSVASIDQLGMILTYKAGMVVITVSLASDPLVFQTMTLQVYDTLSEDNLLDLLTMSMQTYTTSHEWMVYGTGFNYMDHKYESVSRFLFDELEINQSKMLPISNGIRPGYKRPDHPAGITTYNTDNVYWVVVHETANTAQGAGALSHANYLWNAAVNGTVLNTSWHFTMDDKQLYQHVPTDEVAYHAGDGSRLPVLGAEPAHGNYTTPLGGGNRNGIGIETSVAFDGDNYRVWQRTVKLAAQLLVQYNLPKEHMVYHNDFSGKSCPQSIIRGGLISLFEELAYYEYMVEKNFSDYDITFVSNNLDYVDNTGRVINMPDRGTTVSYTVTITKDGVSNDRTFYSYLPGTVH